ncbi:MAG: hypothetical protein ABI821_07250 [Pseudomonadota bacterium]
MNPESFAAEVERIAGVIERYLALHPNASDSLTGITRWWLEGIEPPAPERVEAALQRLVARGRLIRTTLAGGSPGYRGS